MNSRHGPLAGTGLAAFAVGSAVLAPYLTVGLEFRDALESQAVMVLGATVLLGLVGWSRERFAIHRARLPPALWAGLALWAGATLLATTVALARGNDPRLVAGQLLALGLLPLAALGSVSVRPRPLRLGWVHGLVGATALAVTIHFVHWAMSLAEGRLVTRLYLANDVAAVGPVLMALLASVALAVAGGRRERLLGFWTLPLFALYVLGSGVRSLWLVALVAFVALPTLLGGPSVWRRRRIWIGLGALALGFGLAALGAHRWWTAARPNVVPVEDPASSDTAGLGLSAAVGVDPVSPARSVRWTAGDELSVALTRSAPVVAGGVYRGRAKIRGAGVGTCYLVLDWNDTDGEAVVRSLSERAFPEERFRTVEVFAAAPPGISSVSLRLSCEEGTRGSWDVRRLEIHEIGSGPATLAAAQVQQMGRRALSLRELERQGRSADVSLALRWAESAGILRELREATATELLLGRGLGALYRPAPTPFDPESVADPVNYVHNFYLFLPLKMGLLGSLAILVALALFTGFSLSRTFAAADRRARAYHATVSTIWIAYGLWAVACPFLIDFRMAPIWGLLVAAAVPAGDRGGLAAGPATPRSQ